MTDPISVAPWSKDQVDALNAYQATGAFHPFTCGTDSQHPVLVATLEGWRCRACGYEQNWCHAFMLRGAR
jgi:hypothetical protein